ncbi:MAG TPA: dihydrofolate reductase family protein [Solirubrobacteraceae bacterium]|jgi:dihydrofolate reductase
MSKVVVSEFITLDGVIDSPGGEPEFERSGWAFQFERGPEGEKFKFDELIAAGALLLGRITYEAFAKAWPTMRGTGAFGEKMNSIPKYVASRTLERADWNNSTIIGADLVKEVAELKGQIEGDILINGSGQLVRSLMEHDLIDEYRLQLFPVVVGAGKRLFGDSSKSSALRLADTVKAGETLILTYHPA